MEYQEIKKRTWNATKNYCQSLLSNNQRWIFRGQEKSTWTLAPNLERLLGNNDDIFRVELDVLSKFEKSYKIYTGEKPSEDIVDEFSLIQHYGGPTRFLDFTFSYFIAAYFAFEEKRDKNPAVIWAFNLDWLYKEAEKKLKKFSDDRYADFNLIHFEENFKYIIQRKIPAIIPISPSSYNDRMKVQNGIFLAKVDGTKSFEDNFCDYNIDDCKKNIKKITIPYTKREEILNELYLMNLTAEYIYPGLEGFSKSLKFVAEKSFQTYPSFKNK